MKATSRKILSGVREMGNSIAGATTPRCSTTIVITPPSHSEFFEELSLTEREKSIIQKSWTLSEQSTLLNLGQRLFQKIFNNAPEAKRLFQRDAGGPHQFNASFYRHIRAFMNLTEFAVSKIDDEDRGEKLWRTCFEVGKRHVKFREHGFKDEYWATFEIAMLQCVVEWEGAHCNQRTVDSWSKFIAYMVRNMKSGFDYELARLQSSE